MRRRRAAAVVLMAAFVGVGGPAWGQARNFYPPETHGIPPLGWYAMGSVFCAAATPIIGTILLRREMTANEVYRSTLSCLLGPPGWLLANQLFPPTAPPGGSREPPRHANRQPEPGGQGGVPTSGAGGFVPDEVLVEIRAGASQQQITFFLNSLQLTQLAVQTFALTGRTVRLLRITNGRSVRTMLPALRRYSIVSAVQPNHIFLAQQTPAVTSAKTEVPQYVVAKLHLLQAHRLSEGKGVLVAVIDSQIDMHHPDLAGAFAGEDNVLGTPEKPHDHGTAMAGAIAAHGKLIGVAPQARVLAVRAFSGSGERAQGTTFNILKGLDWAAAHGARVVNMSFAGPGDPMLSDMLANAYKRGMVLIAAVGNAGPHSPPLYPAADPHVIGITAIDDHNRLLPQANRGSQVTLAAPGVDILADAPKDGYQITTGTSVAAAHVSGVVALMLARDPKLTPAQVRRALIRAAHKIPDRRPHDVGAGEIDALTAVEEFNRAEK